jgi:uncharacterized OsmC-like protein
LVSVLLLIGLAGCSKDRGELVLKKKSPFIDLTRAKITRHRQ